MRHSNVVTVPRCLRCLLRILGLCLSRAPVNYRGPEYTRGTPGSKRSKTAWRNMPKLATWKSWIFLVSESQVAVVLRLEMTLKKDGQKVSFPRYVQLWTFDESGKVASVCEVYDPTKLLAAWSV